MPELPTDEAKGNESLFSKLQSTPASAVTKKVASVDALTKEEEDGNGRWRKTKKKQVVDKLFVWFMHFLFFVVCVGVFLVAAGGLYLTYKWIGSFVNDPVKLGSFISGVWNTGLVALATLFVNGILPKD